MRHCSHITDFSASPFVRDLPNDLVLAETYNADMDDCDRPPHYLRHWRKHRRMTQQALADALGTSKSVVSDLENDVLQLSPKWLRRLSPVLHAPAGWLLDHDPNELPSDVLEIWADIPNNRRDQALRVLETFKRNGTDG